MINLIKLNLLTAYIQTTKAATNNSDWMHNLPFTYKSRVMMNNIFN
jgi:hypothetical protein